jgi:antitoxin component YwqK of YwqJK toxin-antitoxin module
MEGDFLGGAPDGAQRAWHENGALALEAAYAHGIAHGERREYDERGTLRRRADHADGLAHGEEVLYRADGRVERRGRNVRGLPSGPWLEWDADGALLAETVFLRSGAAVGAVLETANDADGVPHLQVLRVERDGVWSGRATAWRPDGSLASLSELRDGRHHGVQRTYDTTGRLRSEGRRQQGLRTGPWTFWAEAGRLDRTVVYEAGRVVDERAPSPGRGDEG